MQTSTRGGLVALSLSMLLAALGTFIFWLYSLVGSSLQMLVMEEPDSARSLKLFMVFIFSPLLVTVGLFVQAAVTHAILVVLGGGKLGFEATFRVAAYSEAATILLIIPVCGSSLALVWSLVILIMGLYNIHETEPWKAVVAVLAPMLICFSAIGGGTVLLLSSLD